MRGRRWELIAREPGWYQEFVAPTNMEASAFLTRRQPLYAMKAAIDDDDFARCSSGIHEMDHRFGYVFGAGQAAIFPLERSHSFPCCYRESDV